MDKEIFRVLNKHGDMRGNFRIFAKEMFEEKIFADYDVILFFFSSNINLFSSTWYMLCGISVLWRTTC